MRARSALSHGRPPIVERLEKILALEEERGFNNQAVMGGLQRFAEAWIGQASTAAGAASSESAEGASSTIAELLQRYPREDAAGRKRLIAQIRRTLGSPPCPRKSARRRRPPSMAPPRAPQVDLDSPVTQLKGVRENFARRLERLGVRTIRDLLYLFPHRYEDYSALKKIGQLQYSQEASIVARIWEVHSRSSRQRRLSLTQGILSDGTGTIQVTWFNLPPYLQKQLRPGEEFVFSGKVRQYQGRLTLEHPSWEPIDSELIHTGRLVPVYPLTQGVGPRWLRRLLKRTIDTWAGQLLDPLSPSLRQQVDLLDLPTAIQQIHFPDDWELARRARRRLAFDELLLFQLGVLRQRRAWRAQPGRALEIDRSLLDRFLAALPFQLTAAQQRALHEILADLATPQPMSRLLQGDVGSGKTVVAAAAMLVAAANGLQAALMAPTEILAEQHDRTLGDLYRGIEIESPAPGSPRPLQVRLLTGSVRGPERDALYGEIAAGEVDILVGTHALIQAGVEYQALGLVIIDEQHRFGVRQRQALRQKARLRRAPHVLVMSATPIPRSLALTLYGDLDLSSIDELPPGRLPVKTRWVGPEQRQIAYDFLRQQVQQGRQAFVICPLIEDSEVLQVKAATTEFDRLRQEVFPDLAERMGLLHGQMSSTQKDQAMHHLRDGRWAVLVATPVVEVGIDVPNATVMLIEGAERFGLAQLHQLRGRVGRGEYPSDCLLLSDSFHPEVAERLQIIEDTNDGFALAEADLRLRGPGDFLKRQAGFTKLKVASFADTATLEQARKIATQILEVDAELSAPEHKLLAEASQRFWQAFAGAQNAPGAFEPS